MFRELLLHDSDRLCAILIAIFTVGHEEHDRREAWELYWGGPLQRDRFLCRFSDPIPGSSKIPVFVVRQLAAPWFFCNKVWGATS